MSEHDGKDPRRTQMARIYEDHPVTGDRALSFEFEGLARTLAGLAWNAGNETPFTVVVRGGWGRGKTTLLERTRWLLDQPESHAERPIEAVRQVTTLWLNAWKYPSEDTILAGLLGALIDRMDRGSLHEQLGVAVSRHKDLVGKLGRGALRWMADLAGVKTVFEEVLDPESWPGRFAAVERQRALYDDFRRFFDELWYVHVRGTAATVEDLQHKDLPERIEAFRTTHALAVFLDDLDRSPEERVVQTLEAINLFFDQPGVCFYLGLDWARLTGILERRFPAAETREQFLEKIVQVALDLPAVSVDGAAEFVARSVDRTPLGALLKRCDAVSTLAAVLEPKHPRHAKRVLNDLVMRLNVLRNTDHLAVDEVVSTEERARIPEEAVVAWHLLLEASLAVEAQEAIKGRQAFARFVELWKETLRQAAQPGDAGDGAAQGERAGRGQIARLTDREALAKLGPLLNALDGLDQPDGKRSWKQRDLLLHLGSPSPSPGPAAEVAASDRLAVEALFDLNGPSWASLEGGRFEMGSRAHDLGARDNERPSHWVTLTEFRMSRWPITNRQYRAFLAESKKGGSGAIAMGGDNHPVVDVTWHDAREFCDWLGKKLVGGQKGRVRLPTEAEWEFAARGKERRPYPWGEKLPSPERANYSEGGPGTTTPVDSYPQGRTPDAQVWDLAGNVWEWCEDAPRTYTEREVTDPCQDGPARVVRGGSFGFDSGALRGAYRNSSHPDSRGDNLGFRVVWSPAGGPRRP